MSEKIVDIQTLVQDDHNFNKGTEAGRQLMERSFSELGAGRSILVDKDGRIIAGNKSQKAAIAAGIKKVRIIETTGDELVAVKRTDISLDSKEGRELALADNLTTQVNLEWDKVELQEVAAQQGIDLPDWGLDPAEFELTEDEAEIERKRKEFEARMAAGEISEEDEEYQEFLKKFEPEIKKTTDDCYTPELVYEACANWVADYYNLNRKNFVRPFYPGGDYQKEKYPADCVVVDNPPFSIMSEIIRYYNAHGIRFFLFAPHLTLFSGASGEVTCLPVGVGITYANGANVCTSFLTNLEPKNIRFRSEPRLYEAVRKANEQNRLIVVKNNGKMQAKYIYPDNLIQSPFLAQCSRLGFDFVATTEETIKVGKLDSQEGTGKAIFGNGYLVSDRLVAERKRFEAEKYERECAFQQKVEKEQQIKEQKAREEATVWPLSDRELQIIKDLQPHD